MEEREFNFLCSLLLEAEAPRPAAYELRVGPPACDAAAGAESLFAAYHHENTFDNLMLLTNGSLAHKLVHEGFESPTVVYPAGKYCVDDMVVLHNATGAKGEGDDGEDNLEFAYICVSNRVSECSKTIELPKNQLNRSAG